METEGTTADVGGTSSSSSPKSEETGAVTMTTSPENILEDLTLVDAPLSDAEDYNSEHDQLPDQTVDSTEDLRAEIVKQVEYYFSDENLPKDKFLLKHVKNNKAGFVPIGLIASFKKMKRLTKDVSFIADALKESPHLVVSSDKRMVKRRHPLPEVKDSRLCTVIVENLPEDHSQENMQKIFGSVGNLKSINIRDPQAVDDAETNKKGKKLISGKLHALVEYDSTEAAEKAVSTLNDEKDWRTGLRVQLLQKRLGIGSERKVWRGVDADKSSPAQPDLESDNIGEHNDDTPEEEDGEHLSKGKNVRRGRNRRSKGSQKPRGNNGMGHGTKIAVGEVAKPPPGPRMPDGTRGFTLGRGRPLVTTQG